MNTYNNCNVSNSKLNYANISESELLSNNENSLNKQFEIYSSNTKNVKQKPNESFDSIMNKRNHEVQSYFTSPNPQNIRTTKDNQDLNSSNSEHLQNINEQLGQQSNTHNDNTKHFLPYNKPTIAENSQELEQQKNQERVNIDSLELKKANNSIALSDVRNNFALEQNPSLTNEVSKIAAFDSTSFLAAL